MRAPSPRVAQHDPGVEIGSLNYLRVWAENAARSGSRPRAIRAELIEIVERHPELYHKLAWSALERIVNRAAEEAAAQRPLGTGQRPPVLP